MKDVKNLSFGFIKVLNTYTCLLLSTLKDFLNASSASKCFDIKTLNNAVFKLKKRLKFVMKAII